MSFNIGDCEDETDKPEKKDTIDYRALLDSIRITALDDIPPPLVAWSMMNNKGEFDSLGHCGDFSVIIGKAKSRKSFLINIAICAAVSNVPALGVIKSDLKGKQILYFDTEQSNYYVQLAIKRICKATGIENPTNLYVYPLRKYTPSERLELIEFEIYNRPNLGFVIIDGIKDLVTSINDEEQATMIASKLLKWTTETNIHIITVLHQNKSDVNARGHIGTELVNKAETVLSVTKSDKDKEISIVEPVQTRAKEPEMFGFEIIDGLPAIAQDWKIRTESKTQKIDVDDIAEVKLYSLLNTVYSYGSSFSYSDLVIQIRSAFKKDFGKSIGTSKAKDIIGNCKNNKWLTQEGDRKPYTLLPFKSLDTDND
ncbi:MAG: mobilization protein [Flavobacterium sp.]|nr:MAG: mobilization protein [Flavobacterium sp.]